MAFVAAQLTCMAQGNGHKDWHYRTDDTIATVNTAGYFNEVAGVMSLGDNIQVDIVTAPAAPTAISAKHLVYVNANSGTVVDVTDGLAVTATDTD